MIAMQYCSMTLLRWFSTPTDITLCISEERCRNRRKTLRTCANTTTSLITQKAWRRRSSWSSTSSLTWMGRNLSLPRLRLSLRRNTGTYSLRNGSEPIRLSYSDLVTRWFRSSSKTIQSSFSPQALVPSPSSLQRKKCVTLPSTKTWRRRTPLSTNDSTMQRRSSWTWSIPRRTLKTPTCVRTQTPSKTTDRVSEVAIIPAPREALFRAKWLGRGQKERLFRGSLLKSN